MKLGARGACTALCSCLLLACALSAAAVGLKCFSLGSELKGEPFRLGAAAGAFYSGLLLCAGLSLLGSALLCCQEEEEEAAGGEGGKPGAQNLLLLGVLVFMLGVLSAFAGAVIDGDTVSLAERKYSHHCLQQPGVPRAPPPPPPDTAAGCQKLKDYQRGLLISTILNALECLLGLVNLLLVKNYKWARRQQQEQQQRGRSRGGRCRGGRLQRRRRQGPASERQERDFSPGDCPFQAVSYINVGLFHVLDEAGVEVHCGGHPSIELPGYSPTDPDLNSSYPYCQPLPSERPPPYEEIYPAEGSSGGSSSSSSIYRV
ncbi:transmembrane protein 271 [Rhinatrema bivittatum]|uniref:transmembrane protein 271 n=1 Tax=Rhinatrema bivittatum TaxID=194408 RepID=UPI00112AA22A|nr:transmembrane protein 271 [Rhinatrema bivittatum]